MKISISNRQEDLPLARKSIRQVVAALVTFLSISADELSLFFVNKQKIISLHRRFFHDPTPTDCISLPLDTSYDSERFDAVQMPILELREVYLGDIFVCPAVAIEYAARHACNPYEETLLYTVHALLHLIGYDDLDPNQKRIMRKKEKQCMNHLRSLHIQLHS